jgi:hypothetical protein
MGELQTNSGQCYNSNTNEAKMKELSLSRGEGRTRIELLAHYLGSDLIVCIYNENAHLGAVAVGEYNHEEGRASSSVITRSGHRDDEIAKRQAHLIARHTQKAVCVIAGIHLDNITKKEIDEILSQADGLVMALLNELDKSSERG